MVGYYVSKGVEVEMNLVFSRLETRLNGMGGFVLERNER